MVSEKSLIMRKIVLLSILVIATSIVASAQFKIGFKAGANISNIAANDSKNKGGFVTGLLGQYKFSKFAVQPEALFSMQGAKFDGGKVELNYISIPVMAQYYIIPGLLVELGPQVGFLLSADEVPNDGDAVDIKDLLNTTDIAMNFGASYELSAIPLGISARYSLGLSDLRKEGSDAGKNRVFQIGLFVKF